MEIERERTKGVTVSQCHDVYEQSDFSTPGTGVETERNHRHECHFVSQHNDRVHVVRVVGSLDWKIEADFMELIRKPCDEPILIVDLTAARIDAAGTSALVLAAEQARESHHQLLLVATDPVQLSVLISTGLNVVVPVVGSEDEAVTWCEQHGIPAWTVRS